MSRRSGFKQQALSDNKSSYVTSGNNPRSAARFAGHSYPARISALSPVEFTPRYPRPRPVRDPSTPGDRHRYSAFLYSEYFCPADRTDTLSGRPAILEHDAAWVAYLPLFPALHAIGCCHRTLLLFLLLLYCYYKGKALSIPFWAFTAKIARFWQARQEPNGT